MSLTRMQTRMQTLRAILGGIFILAMSSALSFGQQPKSGNVDVCLLWQAHVMSPSKKAKAPPLADSEIAEMQSRVSVSPEADPDNVKALSAETSLEAIGCLLKLEKNTRESTLPGATRLDISQLIAPPRVNLAALYYISYVYSGNWKHASAIALRGPDCQDDKQFFYATRQTCVREAYVAYQDWFAKVQRIGFANAQQRGLQPLAGTDLSWY